MYYKYTFSFYLKYLFISIKKKLGEKRSFEVMCEKLKKLGMHN